MAVLLVLHTVRLSEAHLLIQNTEIIHDLFYRLN